MREPRQEILHKINELFSEVSVYNEYVEDYAWIIRKYPLLRNIVGSPYGHGLMIGKIHLKLRKKFARSV